MFNEILEKLILFVLNENTLWDIDDDAPFEDSIKSMSEIEYKLHALKTFPFSGMPARQQNIQTNLEASLESVIGMLKEPLIQTFTTWLEHHALTDPSAWAEKRVNEFGDDNICDSLGEEEALSGVVHEYIRYKHGNEMRANKEHDINAEFNEILDKAFDNPDDYHLDYLIDAYKDDEETRYMDDLEELGYEEFGEIQGEDFVSEEEAQQWIEKTIEDFEYIEHDYTMESFASSYTNIGGNLCQFIQDVYEHAVFPLWYDYWGSQGIDETRELVEEASDMLNDANTLEENSAAINHAVDVQHQTGDMLDHMETYGGIDVDVQAVKNTMDAIANGEYVDDWNSELVDAGVDVPDAVKSSDDPYEKYESIDNLIECIMR